MLIKTSPYRKTKRAPNTCSAKVCFRKTISEGTGSTAAYVQTGLSANLKAEVPFVIYASSEEKIKASVRLLLLFIF
jgi:hypothetical protein